MQMQTNRSGHRRRLQFQPHAEVVEGRFLLSAIPFYPRNQLLTNPPGFQPIRPNTPVLPFGEREQEGHVHRHDRSYPERQTHRSRLPGLRRPLRQSQRDQRVHQDRQRRVHRRQCGDRERSPEPGGESDDQRHHRRQRVHRLQRHGVRSEPDRRLRAQRQGDADRSGRPDRRRRDRSRRDRRGVGPRRPGRHRAGGASRSSPASTSPRMPRRATPRWASSSRSFRPTRPRWSSS